MIPVAFPSSVYSEDLEAVTPILHSPNKTSLGHGKDKLSLENLFVAENKDVRQRMVEAYQKDKEASSKNFPLVKIWKFEHRNNNNSNLL